MRLLERRCSDRLGLSQPGVTVSNATSGLMLALRAALGDPSPKRPFVAVPSFTFVASVAAILWAGWSPLFVDVDASDWHLSADSLKGLASRSGELAAVMLCSTFGTSASAERRSEIDALTQELGVPVVVDSAAGFGSTDEVGRCLGDQGSLEVFSFHATKPFAIGEGGLVVSSSEDLLARVRQLANFGLDDMRLLPDQVGINAKMPELEAAVGLAVLDGFDRVLEARRRSAGWLLDELAPHGVNRQAGSAGSTFQFVPVLMPDVTSRDRLLRSAKTEAVELKVYFSPPMHRVARLRDFPRLTELRTTEEIVGRIVCLPMNNRMGDTDLERIRDLVVSSLR
ncbi:MAG: DegT/DnrJ/EryC1/StrS family aminotransferase [Actinomycetota bacterium]|nr:DegT/DnrJ/EryC1/StrS family aminotransferase [Actinomycetota bacterium]